MDMATLAALAADTAVRELARTAAAGGSAAVWGWICDRLGPERAAEVARIEAAPERPSARPTVEGLVHDLLTDRPDLARELAQHLHEAGATVARQDATAGDDAQIAQVAGPGNNITQKR